MLGFLKEPAVPNFERKIDDLGAKVKKFHVEDSGYFFFTAPFYVDVAENGDMVWIKIGYAHDDEKLLTAYDLLNNGWLRFEGVEYDRFQGSVTLIGFSKHLPICVISSNILSTSIINYFHNQDSFLVTDNLRFMANLIQNPHLNEDILPMHLLYRAVYGRSTYLEGVFKLTSGEILTWKAGNLSVDLRRGIHAVQNIIPLMPVTPGSVDQFFDLLKAQVGIYLDNLPGKSATMLSGGVDSTLIQAAINHQHPGLSDYPTLSYYLETESFDHEYEYAKQAAHLLNTKHYFVRITPDIYRDYLIRCIEVLGHPPPDDVRPCFLMLTSNLPDDLREVDHYFHGIDAEIFGVQMSLEVVQGDKYKNWPLPVLKLMANLLKMVSASKSYGARTAAEIIKLSRSPDSPLNFLNSEGMYTDYEAVSKSFSEEDIIKAFTTGQALEVKYLDSDLFVEKLNTLDLLTDGMNTTGIMNQLGNFSGISYIFPYADEMILKAVYSYNPMQRYTSGHRVKPILKSALESNLPQYDVNHHPDLHLEQSAYPYELHLKLDVCERLKPDLE